MIVLSLVIHTNDIVWWCGYCDYFVTMYVGVWVCTLAQ